MGFCPCAARIRKFGGAVGICSLFHGLDDFYNLCDVNVLLTIEIMYCGSRTYIETPLHTLTSNCTRWSRASGADGKIWWNPLFRSIINRFMITKQ